MEEPKSVNYMQTLPGFHCMRCHKNHKEIEHGCTGTSTPCTHTCDELLKNISNPKTWEEKQLELRDIPRKSKIMCECSDGSTYIIYDHPDGMYSYCVTEKGNVTHLGLMQLLKKVGDHYILST